MIVTMELQPDAIVNEASLMQRLKCGRTPLREAIQRLVQEDLVVSVPRRGISIPGLSVIEFSQIMEALTAVEGFSARLAAKRITAQQLGRLEENIAEEEDASRRSDLTTIAELDFEFHDIIAQATGNRYLTRMCVHLHHLVTRFGYLGWKNEGNAESSLADHRQIVAALKSRDPEEAERQQTEHNGRAKERLIRVI
jgi:GntR family transcriptional regulator, rspAB operon transcriptional repressor